MSMKSAHLITGGRRSGKTTRLAELRAKAEAAGKPAVDLSSVNCTKAYLATQIRQSPIGATITIDDAGLRRRYDADGNATGFLSTAEVVELAQHHARYVRADCEIYVAVRDYSGQKPVIT